MQKYKSYFAFGGAVFLALIATVMIMGWLRTSASVKQTPAPETQNVVVAKVNLQWGSVISKEMIDTKPFLKRSVPPGSFSDVHGLVGRVLVSSVVANEPILESRLAPVTLKAGGVAAVVGSKKRAVAVKVDKYIGVSGFIHPGNRVDVLVTLSPGRNSDPMTKIVLQNILVLAAGPEVESKGKEEKQSTVDVITLEVTPGEAEKLALAATEGKLQLALRNYSDPDDVVTKGMTVPLLLASYSGSPLRGKPKPTRETRLKSPKAPYLPQVKVDGKTDEVKKSAFIVEVIRGTKLSEVKLEGGQVK